MPFEKTDWGLASDYTNNDVANLAKEQAGEASKTANDANTTASTAKETADCAQKTATQTASDLSTFASKTTSQLTDMQGQIDGSICTWFFSVPPTSANAPAASWSDTDTKNKHLGDVYYDTNTGYTYRYQVLQNVYSWQRITDVDVTKALADAALAKDTADHKRRVFTAQPNPPYDKGDLWSNGQDLRICAVSKTDGMSYLASDWTLATDYTDNTLAQKAKDQIDGLKVGGTNLLQHTDDGKGWHYSGFDSTQRTFTIDASTSEAYIYPGAQCTIINGEEYTLSAYVKQVNGVKSCDFFCFDKAMKATQFKTFNVTSDWQLLAWTFTADSTADYAEKTCIRFDNNGAETAGQTATLFVRDIKLERGNHATDWSPCPLDTQEGIAAASKAAAGAQSTADTAQASATQAQQTADATKQHFYADDSGAHVTADAGDTTSGANMMLTSAKLALRHGAQEVASFTESAISFLSGLATVAAREWTWTNPIDKSAETHQGIDVKSPYASSLTCDAIRSDTGAATTASVSVESKTASMGNGGCVHLHGHNLALSDYEITKEDVYTSVTMEHAMRVLTTCDVPIEQGTSGNWKWTKWSSGNVDLYGNVSNDTYTRSGASGNLVLSNVNSATFPFTLKTIQTVQVSAISPEQHVFCTALSNTAVSYRGESWWEVYPHSCRTCITVRGTV